VYIHPFKITVDVIWPSLYRLFSLDLLGQYLLLGSYLSSWITVTFEEHFFSFQRYTVFFSLEAHLQFEALQDFQTPLRIGKRRGQLPFMSSQYSSQRGW
jgi:hypothetical protein